MNRIRNKTAAGPVIRKGKGQQAKHLTYEYQRVYNKTGTETEP